MRRWIAGAFAAGLALAGGYAAAQIVPALPFQLQNNTVADATQVMANFNQLLNNINANGAKNGANSDITSLLGLTTPLAPSVGGTTTWVGGTSTGSANAQVVATVVPNTFSLAAGNQVVFKAGFTNTGPWTLNVAGSGAKNVFRQTSVGTTASGGAEVIVGSMVKAVYDGVQFQIVSFYQLIGEIRDFTGASIPIGWLVTDGSCVSQATYAALFTAIGSAWGSCGAGLFALPDTRGRATIAPDSGVGRVTAGGSGCNAISAAGCGAQNQVVAQGNLPNISLALAISDTRVFTTPNNYYPANGVGPFVLGGGANAGVAGAISFNMAAPTSGSIGGTAALGGSGTALVTLPPVLVANKIIKY